MKKTGVILLLVLLMAVCSACTITRDIFSEIKPEAQQEADITPKSEDEETEGSQNGKPSYSTTQPSLEMLPDLDGFSKSYSLSDYSIIYTSDDELISINFYIMPASPEVIKEMATQDLSEYNKYKDNVNASGQGVVMSEGAFETIAGKPVLTFNSNTGADGTLIYEYHYLDGGNIIVLITSDLTENAPSNLLNDAVKTIIAH